MKRHPTSVRYQVTVEFAVINEQGKIMGDTNFKSLIKRAGPMLADSARMLTQYCHGISDESGWWPEPEGIDRDSEVPKKLLLIVSEVCEAMEGHRKDLMDTHLPHRKMIEVELADALIRIYDLAGALGLDVAGALAEKLVYNTHREDHKLEVRAAAGGKKY